MGEDKYYIISNSDGDTYIEEVSKEEVLKRVNSRYYGDVEFLTEITDEDTNYWGDVVLIIKGSVVVPKPTTTVIEHDIAKS